MTAGPSAEVPARSALPRRMLAGYALGSLPSLPALTPDDVTPEIVAGLADSLGLAGGDFGRMAGVNTVLNACPPALREALLTGFLSLLQQAED
jgi:hypothetical protein